VEIGITKNYINNSNNIGSLDTNLFKNTFTVSDRTITAIVLKTVLIKNAIDNSVYGFF